MKRRGQKRADTPAIRRVWTIACLLLVCAVALLARGVLIYRIYPLEFEDNIARYSAEYELDSYLVCAVINAESNFNPDVESHKGAVGLMQIMPSTGEWVAGKIGIENYSESMLTDPDTNIRIGCWYLHYLDGLFDGNGDYVIAAYNAGQGNVQQWIESDAALEDIPYPETENYLKKVKTFYEIYQGLYSL